MKIRAHAKFIFTALFSYESSEMHRIIMNSACFLQLLSLWSTSLYSLFFASEQEEEDFSCSNGTVVGLRHNQDVELYTQKAPATEHTPSLKNI